MVHLRRARKGARQTLPFVSLFSSSLALHASAPGGHLEVVHRGGSAEPRSSRGPWSSLLQSHAASFSSSEQPAATSERINGEEYHEYHALAAEQTEGHAVPVERPGASSDSSSAVCPLCLSCDCSDEGLLQGLRYALQQRESDLVPPEEEGVPVIEEEPTKSPSPPVANGRSCESGRGCRLQREEAADSLGHKSCGACTGCGTRFCKTCLRPYVQTQSGSAPRIPVLCPVCRRLWANSARFTFDENESEASAVPAAPRTSAEEDTRGTSSFWEDPYENSVGRCLRCVSLCCRYCSGPVSEAELRVAEDCAHCARVWLCCDCHDNDNDAYACFACERSCGYMQDEVCPWSTHQPAWMTFPLLRAAGYSSAERCLWDRPRGYFGSDDSHLRSSPSVEIDWTRFAPWHWATLCNAAGLRWPRRGRVGRSLENENIEDSRPTVGDTHVRAPELPARDVLMEDLRSSALPVGESPHFSADADDERAVDCCDCCIFDACVRAVEGEWVPRVVGPEAREQRFVRVRVVQGKTVDCNACRGDVQSLRQRRPPGFPPGSDHDSRAELIPERSDAEASAPVDPFFSHAYRDGARGAELGENGAERGFRSRHRCKDCFRVLRKAYRTFCCEDHCCGLRKIEYHAKRRRRARSDRSRNRPEEHDLEGGHPHRATAPRSRSSSAVYSAEFEEEESSGASIDDGDWETTRVLDLGNWRDSATSRLWACSSCAIHAGVCVCQLGSVYMALTSAVGGPHTLREMWAATFSTGQSHVQNSPLVALGCMEAVMCAMHGCVGLACGVSTVSEAGDVQRRAELLREAAGEEAPWRHRVAATYGVHDPDSFVLNSIISQDEEESNLGFFGRDADNNSSANFLRDAGRGAARGSSAAIRSGSDRGRGPPASASRRMHRGLEGWRGHSSFPALLVELTAPQQMSMAACPQEELLTLFAASSVVVVSSTTSLLCSRPTTADLQFCH